jgi:3-deoxy-manno-octulosonate cytidylyltransferase (CMP-KDO synthetase)
MKFLAIIPARYASSRFPGKPLADLGGLPMVQRVYEQAKKVLDTVIVATDDKRIYDCVKTFGGEAVMTSSTHTCGTDRVYEAYQHYCAISSLPVIHTETVVINIQGDEPFIQPEQVQALMNCFPTEIATLVHPFTKDDTLEDLQNPNYVKVAIARESSHTNSTIGRAMYFSRSAIPYIREAEAKDWPGYEQHFRHIGMYAYRADVLQKITQLPPSPLEKLECLEQLRWLEHGLTIRVALTNHASIGIDTPEDLQYALEYLNNSK